MDNTIKFWILWLTQLIYQALDALFYSVSGTSLLYGSRQEQEEANRLEKSAQIVNIVWRAKFNIFRVTRKQYFLYYHDKYVRPDYVLQHENVTLLAVEKDYAMFAVTDPKENMYDSSKFPFLFVSQYLETKKLVIMPIRSFHKLADELGDPEVPVAMTAMTTRCGSTLLTQMFNRVPGTRAMSEPWATVNIHELRCTGSITADESCRLIRSAIRLHCKVEPGSGVKRIFMKMTSFHGPQFGDFGKLFPQFIYFFNTRHPIPSLKSLKHVVLSSPMDLSMLLGLRWREMANMKFTISYYSKYDHLSKRYNKWIPYRAETFFGLFTYSMTILAYFDNKNLFNRTILYENLTREPEEELKKVFNIFGVSLDHIPVALDALKKDSQNGIWGQRGGGHSYVLDPRYLSTFDEYMKEMDLPIRHGMTEEEFKELFK